MNYYNDNDPNSAAWLRELIARGVIANGVVDDRSILDVQPDDLRGFTQCHFFAGIGAWSFALRLAGWPDDRPVWTGSPPCFPEEVLVTTKRGFVPIKEVAVGDLCLTHAGNWKPVLRVGSAMKQTLEVVGQGHFGLRTTHDHPFFARGRRIKSTRRNGKAVRVHEIGDSHWRKAKDMADFWWAMPTSLPDLDLPIYPSGYTDTEIGLLCGLYIGDGWITKGNSKGNLALGVSEKKADEIEAALPGVRFSRHRSGTGVRLVLIDTALGEFLRDHFGQGSKTKTLPLWLFAASPELQEAFVAGWDMTDGTREEIAGSRRITTTSRDLAVIGRMLLVTMGFAVSMRKVVTPETTTIEGRTVNQADYYTLSRSNCARYSFSDDLHKWFKVKSVVDHGETVRVYDIEVADDHSYIADGIAVHNCQPFSVAGLGLAVDDPRHLSPKFASLVRSCCPGVLFGEQVASAQVFGSSAKPSRKGSQGAPAWAWLDDLCDRLEAAHYAVGASDIPSAGVGAPHQRQRTFFGAIRLADADDAERRAEAAGGHLGRGPDSGRAQGSSHAEGRGGFCGLADLHGDGCEARLEVRSVRAEHDAEYGLSAGGLADGLGAGLEGHGRHGDDRDQSGRIGAFATGSASSGDAVGGLADSERYGRERSESYGTPTDRRRRPADESLADCIGRPGPTNGFWRDADWLFCRDELWRPVGPGSFPLVDGAAARVGRLRGYGNAINPWAAKVYIEGFCEAAGIPLVPDYLDALGLMSLYR